MTEMSELWLSWMGYPKGVVPAQPARLVPDSPYQRQRIIPESVRQEVIRRYYAMDNLKQIEADLDLPPDYVSKLISRRKLEKRGRVKAAA